MAMTVVLPAPVASLRARRVSSGFASALAFARCSRNFFPALPFGSNLGQPNCRLGGLYLAEKWPYALKLDDASNAEEAAPFQE
jgi:hypothetical protein